MHIILGGLIKQSGWYFNPVSKIAEKEVYRSVFLTIWPLYFECRININALLDCFLTILPTRNTITNLYIVKCYEIEGQY